MVTIEDDRIITSREVVTITLDKDDALRLMHVCGRIGGWREHPIRLVTQQIYRHIFNKFCFDNYDDPNNKDKNELTGMLYLERDKV